MIFLQPLTHGFCLLGLKAAVILQPGAALQEGRCLNALERAMQGNGSTRIAVGSVSTAANLRFFISSRLLWTLFLDEFFLLQSPFDEQCTIKPEKIMWLRS